MAITINGSNSAGNINLGTNGTITGLAVGGLPDGSVDADSLAAGTVTEYSDVNIRRDLLTLALQTAVDTNRKAYNLQNSFIDQFEDDTGIGTETNTDRLSGEYVSSIQVEAVGGNDDTYSKGLHHCEDEQTNSITGGPGFVEVSNTNASTSQAKFGSRSMYFDGNGDWLKCTTGTGSQVGTWEPEGDDFTLDFWMWTTSTSRMSLYAGETDYWFGLDYHMNGTRNVNLWASSDGSDWDMLNGDSGGNGIGTVSYTHLTLPTSDLV